VPEEALTPEKVAQILSVRPKTIRDWLKRGRIKGFKAGRLWRIREKDLDAFLSQARAEMDVETRVWLEAEVSGALPRLAAAAIDHLLLGAIDIAVLYFTLRMAGLTMAELSVLPVVPLVVFLLLVKLSYFSAFTAVGGQTIGKMATRIRVVTGDDETVDGPLAVKRTLAGVASAALFGLGFVPALIGPERRALHDRLTHTRVVALPSA